MNIKEAERKIRQLGLVPRREGGEWCIHLPGHPEADYFTDDNEDAVATAQAMVTYKA